LNPAATIIVPIYNTEKYIRKCLESIMSQSFRDIEILCIDDNSSDHSVEIVESLQAQDLRIKLVRHQLNLGPGAARNTGIRLSTAPYVAFVDSDDYVSPLMMEKSYHYAAEGGDDIIIFGFDKVDESGTLLSTYLPQEGYIDSEEPPSNLFSFTNPSVCNKLWKKSLFVENKIFFPDRQHYSDLATTPRLLFKARRVGLVREALYKYLKRLGSITNTHSAKHILDYIRTFDLLKEFLINEGVFEVYKKQFESAVRAHILYHAMQVHEGTIGHAQERQYLKHLLLLRDSYLKFDDEVRVLSADELLTKLTWP
jgi:glycosyltransferase involved in cell wall biosynthesis